ncbi:hypothetical protein CC78DRAFT_565850 [Lojkania enalia]|uniref:Glycosyl transferase CAP10 domain-containing protein n=1 Tax=Lojkania enalia TaxID=147567 RepID=A0A9P4KJ62_9PLEO|nr:hypothetical protein CC78DRAFT_565850 [Didymosphaeria enalia]
MARIHQARRVLSYVFGISCLFVVFLAVALLGRPLAFDHPQQLPDLHSPPTSQLALQDSAAPAISIARPSNRPSLPVYGNNYGLSSTECSSQFPYLFREIERSVALRGKIGNVSLSDIDVSWRLDGAVRAMIYDQKVYVIQAGINGNGYHRTRSLALLHQINRAILASRFAIPNVEFSFNVHDVADELHEHRTIWGLSRQPVDIEMWLMPDFGYWSWPLDLVGGYEQMRAEMGEYETDWNKKISKALWRGDIRTNKEVRGALVRVTRGKEWADVEEMAWTSMTDVSDGSAGVLVPIPEHCTYKFLVQTEGHSYSGRGKYLLNCASITIMHRAEWIEPHHHLLVPSGPLQNFVEVERDFSDLEEKVEELLQDPERAKAIVNNSVATFRDRYLTPAAQACYWRQLFLSWASDSGVWQT